MKESSISLASTTELARFVSDIRRNLQESGNAGVQQLADLCELITNTKGQIYFTAAASTTAHVAQKVCHTLMSVNIKCSWLDPVSALHGDIGGIGSNELVILLSPWGECVELLRLIDNLNSKKCETILMSLNEVSRLGCKCDRVIVLKNYLQKEMAPCDYELRTLLACTFATNVLLSLDTCIAYIMTQTGLTRSAYLMNHPAGAIGKSLLLVSDVCMNWENLTLVKASDTGFKLLVDFAAASALIGCLLVVDDRRRLLGTVSDADFRRALFKKGREALHMTAHDIMNYNKGFPRWCKLTDPIASALAEMNSNPPVSYLPVLSDSVERLLLGVLTYDCIK